MTCHCGAEIAADRYACTDCTAALHADLTRAADHLDHVDDKRARRGSRSIASSTSRSAAPPIPFDARVSETLTPIRVTLTTRARLIVAEHQCSRLPDRADTRAVARAIAERDAWDQAIAQHRSDLPFGVTMFRRECDTAVATARMRADLTDLAQVARWTADHAEWIATRPWAMEVMNDATDIRQSLDRLMDTPPERYPLGECGHDECTHPLVAVAGDGTVTCPRCGWTHDVAQRRLDALRRSDDMVVTVKEAARLLRLAGSDVQARDLWALIRHFGISAALTVKVPGATKSSSVYRLGVLREAAEQMADRDVREAVARLRRGA